MKKTDDRQKVALVLSGGGARGIAHIGVIEELEARGYEITSIAGTSMGSLIGGVYACGKLPELKEWIYSLDRGKVLRLVDLTLNRQGLIKGDRVLGRMQDFIPDVNIEDLPLPYAAVAADLTGKEEVVFTEGSLYHAIRASIAIPSLFTPVREGKSVLVDGGILNNIPMAHVKRNEGDIMVASFVNADIPADKPVLTVEGKEQQKAYNRKIRDFNLHIRKSPSSTRKKLGYFSIITKTFDLMTLRMAEDKIREFDPEILIQVSRESCNVYDFYKAEQQVEAGRRAAVRVLENIEKKNHERLDLIKRA